MAGRRRAQVEKVQDLSNKLQAWITDLYATCPEGYKVTGKVSLGSKDPVSIAWKAALEASAELEVQMEELLVGLREKVRLLGPRQVGTIAQQSVSNCERGDDGEGD